MKNLHINLAKKSEPYWWLEDNKGLIHKQYFSIYKVKSKEQDGIIYGVICGRVHIRYLKWIK